MAQQTIGVGTVANDNTGDPLRTAFTKVNANFTELYTAATTTTSGIVELATTAEVVTGTDATRPVTPATLLGAASPANWTPVLTFATPGNLAVAYAANGQVGRYVKVGKLVTVSFDIQTSTFTHTTATGNLNITGLPFPVETLTGLTFEGPVSWGGITKAGVNTIVATAGSGASLLTLTYSGTGIAQGAIAFGDMPTGGTVILRGTLTYFTA